MECDPAPDGDGAEPGDSDGKGGRAKRVRHEARAAGTLPG